MQRKTEVDFLDEINSKYSDLENDLEHQLQILADDDRKLQTELEKSDKRIVETPKKLCDTLEEAKKRNSEILKGLEMAKARLRSRTTYSPIETILQKAIHNYNKEYSLMPIGRKTYGPTYV